MAGPPQQVVERVFYYSSNKSAAASHWTPGLIHLTEEPTATVRSSTWPIPHPCTNRPRRPGACLSRKQVFQCPHAAAVLEQALAVQGPPTEALRHSAVSLGGAGDSWLRRHDALGLPGYDLVCPADQAARIWERLTRAGARPAGREACEILRVEA